jgi:hypothetical protein
MIPADDCALSVRLRRMAALLRRAAVEVSFGRDSDRPGTCLISWTKLAPLPRHHATRRFVCVRPYANGTFASAVLCGLKD